jgi:hypothetical protein
LSHYLLWGLIFAVLWSFLLFFSSLHLEPYMHVVSLILIKIPHFKSLTILNKNHAHNSCCQTAARCPSTTKWIDRIKPLVCRHKFLGMLFPGFDLFRLLLHWNKNSCCVFEKKIILAEKYCVAEKINKISWTANNRTQSTNPVPIYIKVPGFQRLLV